MNIIENYDGINGAYIKPSSAPPCIICLILLILVIYIPFCIQGVNLAVELIPNQITLSLFGISKTISDLKLKFFDMVAFAAIAVPAVAGLELALVGWRNSSIRRLFVSPKGSAQTDWISFILGQAYLYGVIAKILTLGLVIWITSAVSELVTKQWGLVLINLSNLPLWSQVGFYFILYTFFDYWAHRFYHTPRFWPLHRFHHSAREFTLLTTFRQHPVDFLGAFVINLPMALLGAPAEILVTVSIIVSLIGMIIHSNIDSSWGFVGRYLIQSPNHHRLHHVLDYKRVGVGHFGILPVWDHLFGSWIGDANHSLAIGVDRYYGFGLRTGHDIVRDYYDALKALIGLKYKE